MLFLLWKNTTFTNASSGRFRMKSIPGISQEQISGGECGERPRAPRGRFQSTKPGKTHKKKPADQHGAAQPAAPPASQPAAPPAALPAAAPPAAPPAAILAAAAQSAPTPATKPVTQPAAASGTWGARRPRSESKATAANLLALQEKLARLEVRFADSCYMR